MKYASRKPLAIGTVTFLILVFIFLVGFFSFKETNFSNIAASNQALNIKKYAFLNKHDPVYSNVFSNRIPELSDLAKEIIPTAHFQRLYKVVQLGNCMVAHEHAFGTRASHCKGVAKLSTVYLSILANNSNIQLHPAEMLAVQIAGLLHDVGHGPYSHLFEPIASRGSGGTWTHEKNSVDIVKYLFNQHPYWIERYSLPQDFIDAVCDMIVGISREHYAEKYANSKVFRRYFIFTIVNAKKSHLLDADKMDYLMRDSYLNTKLDFCKTMCSHIEKIILGAKVVDDTIAFKASTSYNFYEVGKFYYLLYRYLYYHPKSHANDLMLGEAFEEIGPAFDLQQKISPLEEFITLTDSFFDIASIYANLHKSKYPKAASLFERFFNGEGYELGGYYDYFYNDETYSPDIKDKATERLIKACSLPISKEDFIFAIVEMAFFSKKKRENGEVNPLKKAVFYDSSLFSPIHRPRIEYLNSEAIYVPYPENMYCGYESNLHPVHHFGTWQLRLYIKTLDPVKQAAIKKAFQAIFPK